MANVLDLRRRIRSVKNTRQITKAMQMVSAAKLRRAQEAAVQARPYAQMLANVLESLVRRTDLYDETTGDILHPLLVQREEKNVLVIVVAGDKGFAGAFNSNIIKAAQTFIDSSRTAGKNVDIEPIGRKSRDLYRKRYPEANYQRTEQHYDNDLSTHYETIRHRAAPIEIVGDDHTGLLTKLNFAEVTEVGDSVVARYEQAEIDAVYLVYNEFKSVMAQRVVVEKLLPIKKLGAREVTSSEEMTEDQRDAAVRAAEAAGVQVHADEAETAEIDAEAKKFGTSEVDYIFDQPPEQIFRHLLPRYVATEIFHTLLESAAAEHAARMTAMEAATSNAGDMIDALSLTMNRVRQAAITKEIIEIVSGAAAL